MDRFIKKLFKAYFKGCIATGLFIMSILNFIGITIVAMTSLGDVDFFKALAAIMFFTWVITFSLHKIIWVINVIKD